MSYFAVRYTYTGEPGRRDAVRPEHRRFLGGLADEGFVVASGPLTGSDPAAALLVVRADDAAQVLDRLADDPFALAGVVAEVTVEAWEPVIGVLTA